MGIHQIAVEIAFQAEDMILSFTDQIHHSAHGAGAIETGGRAFHNADFGDIIDEDLGDVHIAPIATIQRPAIDHDQDFVFAKTADSEVAFVPGASGNAEPRACFQSFRDGDGVFGQAEAFHSADAGLRAFCHHSHRMQVKLL